MVDVEELKKKYSQRINKELSSGVIQSKSYNDFKDDIIPKHHSIFEKYAIKVHEIFKLSLDDKTSKNLELSLEDAHLNIPPGAVFSLAVAVGLFISVFGSLIGFIITLDTLTIFASMIFGLLSIFIVLKYPEYLAIKWRMKTTNQMVQSIFYIVTYMRHTSNLENAIKFAADHLEPPISLDFRKILWDAETEKYPSVQESANKYMEKWKTWSPEFIESFHLVESSLYEPTESRRLSLLDKSLDVILNGTYENMLHYAHNLKSPMTMLHMLGVILPIMGLVILPLAVSFMNSGDQVPDIQGMALMISLVYNVGLPLGVTLIGLNILNRRPAGYGQTDITEQLKKGQYKTLEPIKGFKLNVAPKMIFIGCLLIAGITFILPFMVSFLSPTGDINLSPNFKMLEYVCFNGAQSCQPFEKVGPFGIGASVFSIIGILFIGLAAGLYYKVSSSDVISIRDKTRKLEDEFSSALFQLGNRLGDGLPAEIAFGKVSKSMQGSTTSEFFSVVTENLTKLGMGLEQAIFDPKNGAISKFPSKVIESSMKVLVDAAKKGPLIASQALLSMSRYIKEIHRVEERLKDLMSDVIASMKSQISFLTPAIAGIVIGITSMISTILTRLTSQLSNLTGDTGGVGGTADLANIFGVGMPTYYFQAIVGLYVVQLAYILTVLSSGIENGSDKLSEKFNLGKNLIGSTALYCILAITVTILFNSLAIGFLSN